MKLAKYYIQKTQYLLQITLFAVKLGISTVTSEMSLCIQFHKFVSFVTMKTTSQTNSSTNFIQTTRFTRVQRLPYVSLNNYLFKAKVMLINSGRL